MVPNGASAHNDQRKCVDIHRNELTVCINLIINVAKSVDTPRTATTMIRIGENSDTNINIAHIKNHDIALNMTPTQSLGIFCIYTRSQYIHINN